MSQQVFGSGSSRRRVWCTMQKTGCPSDVLLAYGCVEAARAVLPATMQRWPS